MPPSDPLAVGDAFQVNGHFACVVHVNMEAPPGGLALVRIFADNALYQLHAGQVLALRTDFEVAMQKKAA